MAAGSAVRTCGAREQAESAMVAHATAMNFCCIGLRDEGFGEMLQAGTQRSVGWWDVLLSDDESLFASSANTAANGIWTPWPLP
jgi:hypothetical protein